jgi:hypothetical protein
MFYLGKFFQEVFIDAAAALVERAGAAMGTSLTGLHLLNGKWCTKALENSPMPYAPSYPIMVRF